MAAVETIFAPDEGQHAVVTQPTDANGNLISFPGAYSWVSDSTVASVANISADSLEADLLGNKVDEGTATVTVSNTDTNGGMWAGTVTITVKKSAPPPGGELAITLGPVFKQAA